MSFFGTSGKEGAKAISKGALRQWLKPIGIGLGIAAPTVGARIGDENVFDFMGDATMKYLNIKQKEGESRIHAVLRSGGDAVMSSGTVENIEQKAEDLKDDVLDSLHTLTDTTRGVARSVTGGGDGESHGLFGGIAKLFSGLTGGISSLLGGGGGFNIGAALMLPLAWFAFGKFGWIGKVGALAMLMYGLSNLFSHETQERQLQPEVAAGGGRKATPAERAYEEMNRQESAGVDDMYNTRRV